MERVHSYKHLGHTINSKFDDSDDIEDRRISFVGQVNSVLCFFGKLKSSTKLHLFNSYCTSFFGSELWDFNSSSIETLSIAWRKALRRIWSLPNMTHGYLLPLVSSCLPLFDMLCLRYLSFVSSCMFHESELIKNITKYSIVFGGMKSPLCKNFTLCKERYSLFITDLSHPSLLKNKVFYYIKTTNSETQNSLGCLLRELLLIREQTFELTGGTYCSDGLLSTEEIDCIIHYISVLS